jgi:hypothetical protein
MLEQYEKAAKASDIDIGKMWLHLVRPLVKEEEQTRKQRNRMRKEMK